MGTHALTHTMQHAFTHPYHIPPPPTHTHTHPENPHSSPQSDKPEVTDTYVYIVGQGLVSPLATDVFAPAETESYVHPFSYGYGYGSGSGPGAPSAAGKQDYVFAPPAEVCGWVAQEGGKERRTGRSHSISGRNADATICGPSR